MSEGAGCAVAIAVAIALLFVLGLFLAYPAVMLGLVVLGIAGIAASYYYPKYQAEQKRRAQRQERRRRMVDERYALLFSVMDAPESLKTFIDNFAEVMTLTLRVENIPMPPRSLAFAIVNAAADLYQASLQEPFDPLNHPVSDNLLAEEQKNEELRATIANRGVYDPKEMTRVLIRSFLPLLKAVPHDEDGQLLQRVRDAVPNLASVVSEMATPFYENRHLSLSKVVLKEYNAQGWKARNDQRKRKSDQKLVWPGQYKGDPIDYLTEPLADIFDETIPYRLGTNTRYAHQWILGQPGTGKSTLLANLIHYDLERVKEGKRSIIIMDSQGEKGIARNIAKLPMFAPGNEMHDRLVYFSARDKLAINPFILHDRSEEAKEGAVGLLTYMMGDLFEGDLARLQEAPVANILRLVLELPHPTIKDFEAIILGQEHRASREVLYSLPPQYTQYLSKLPPRVQDYFNGAYGRMFKATRDGIVGRVATLRSLGNLDDMLCAKTNEFNLHSQLNEGKVIIIDAQYRDERLTEAFGRFFTALTLQATFERDSIPADRLKPLFFYIDEADQFIRNDGKFSEMLFRARKQHVGFVVAHQVASQIVHPLARKGLEVAAIQTACIRLQGGLVRNHIGAGEMMQERILAVPPNNFIDVPKMTAEQWQATLAAMTRYHTEPVQAQASPLPNRPVVQD